MTPTELTNYIDSLRAAGVTGRVKIGEFELDITPAAEVTRADAKAAAAPRSAKQQYDDFLFAATEGLPEREDAS